ncbi:hypothetical protein NOL01_10730 [Streptococcus suis]|nr:hypothetical protein [Streptococcus suis]
MWLRFLLTGTAGHMRNLVSDEITDQLLAIALAIWYNKGEVELYLKR